MKSKKLMMIIGVSLVLTSSVGIFTSANAQENNISTVAVSTSTVCTQSPSASTITTKTPGTETPKYSDAKNFKFDEKTGTIEAYYGNDKVLKIPETINGVTVKRIISTVHAPGIGEHQISFVANGAPNVEEVIIPKTVQTIGDFAFLGCINLKKVELNEGLKVIGNSAFYGCSLEKVTIPDTVIEVKDLAFTNNEKLSEVNVPSNLDVSKAFFYTPFEKDNEAKNNGFFIVNNIVEKYVGNDEVINIPEGVTKISFLSYDLLSKAKEINFPKSLEYIYTQFSCMPNLSKVVFPDESNIRYIADESFCACTKLNEVNISSKKFKGKLNIVNENQKLIVNGKEEHYVEMTEEELNRSVFLFDEKTGTISGYVGDDIDIVIPYSINGVKVNYIEADEESIKNGYGILGGNGIVQSIKFQCDAEIKSNAFLNSDNLKSIKYSKKLKVDSDAFKNCDKLVNVSGIEDASADAYSGSPVQDYSYVGETAGTFDNNNILVLFLTMLSCLFILFKNRISLYIRKIFK